MNIRETIEKMGTGNPESVCVAECEYTGTERKEPLCDIRPEYQRDRDRILHSKSFRRLETENAGFSGAGGRPLPDAPDAHAGSIADSAHDRESAAAE